LGVGVALAEAFDRDAEALADARTEAEAEARAEADEAEARAEAAAEDWPTVGVRVGLTAPLVCGVGVKTDGVAVLLPPLVQAATVTASSRAPAAERPAVSHAPWAGTGRVRRIFMNPPRMRVR
jgi:hypothetical protein